MPHYLITSTRIYEFVVEADSPDEAEARHLGGLSTEQGYDTIELTVPVPCTPEGLPLSYPMRKDRSWPTTT